MLPFVSTKLPYMRHLTFIRPQQPGVRHLQKGDAKAAEAEFRRVIELNQNGRRPTSISERAVYDAAERGGQANTRSGSSAVAFQRDGHYLNGRCWFV